MAIDFFDSACSSHTTAAIFGVIDAPPVKISLEDANHWHVWVDNPSLVSVTVVALDHCVLLPSSFGKRCDALIKYNQDILFLEIKDRASKGWLADAIAQLENTIANFGTQVDVTIYHKKRAHIANRQKPRFKANAMTVSQKFLNDTRFILEVSEVIAV